MSIQALTDAITNLDTDVKALIAASANTVPQADIDAAVAAVNAVDAEVKAALPPIVQATQPE